MIRLTNLSLYNTWLNRLHYRSNSNLSYNHQKGIISNAVTSKPLCRTLIGLEIHAQLSTPTKLFSQSRPDEESEPNSTISFFDIAYPGVLPVLSGHAVKDAILTSCALNCTINPVSRFERKHYIYPDLPHGYQITQQRWPFASCGVLKVHDELNVHIDRIQLEMDSGKTNNQENGIFLDYNRAGMSLLEIVSKPTLHSSSEAAETIQFLRRLLRRIKVCDGKMEQGSLRADVNISIFPYDTEKENISDNISVNSEGLNTNDELVPNSSNPKVEIKNLNSIRQVVSAIEYEGIRQTKLFLSCKKISRETRTFDPNLKKTVLLRKKEGEVDYRFMPDPNLPPLKLNPKTLNGKTLQEIIESFQPLLLNSNEHDIIQKLIEEYGLSSVVASQLGISDFIQCIPLFHHTVQRLMQEIPTLNKFQLSSTVANWICNDYFYLMKHSENESCIDPSKFTQLLLLIINKQITTVAGKKILGIIHRESQKCPLEIAKENGFISNASSRESFEQMVQDLVMDSQYEKQRLQYKKGGKYVNKIHKFFVGKIMQKTKGIWEPDLVHHVLKLILERLR